MFRNCSWLVCLAVASAGVLLSVSVGTSYAQVRYSEVKVEALASGEEISGQPGLWVMELYFKPMRMIAVDITNPQTGKKEPKYVWYLVYRAINRPLASITVENPPVNQLDAPVLPAKFIPEFTLVTTDTDPPQVLHDQVIPEALAAINTRERRKYKTSVSVVDDVPPAAAAGDAQEQMVYGVAMFTGVDPAADQFTVYLTGFSNGVQKTTTPDGTVAVQHKTIEMKYIRPGDEFDLREPELKLAEPPRWIYR